MGLTLTVKVVDVRAAAAVSVVRHLRVATSLKTVMKRILIVADLVGHVLINTNVEKIKIVRAHSVLREAAPFPAVMIRGIMEARPILIVVETALLALPHTSVMWIKIVRVACVWVSDARHRPVKTFDRIKTSSRLTVEGHALLV